MSSTVSIESGDALLQGDIIRKIPNNVGERARWGFILTADCDIAQKKSGQTYSWLEIMRAADFLEQVWCHEQFLVYIRKYSQACMDSINSIIKRHHPTLSLLSKESLCEWLRESEVDSMLNILIPSGEKFDNKAKELLNGLHAALNPDTSDKLSTLKRCWAAAGISDKEQEARIRNYLLSSDGFPDFFVIPDIPDEEGFCFIIMLRAISTVDTGEIFLSELDARIAGKSHLFHRIGRFNDNIRYAVVQKFSFLFSRIGMPSHFENASKAAADILVESIFQRAKK